MNAACQPKHRLALLSVLACLALATHAGALGFRNPDQSARATAQGEAFVAQADDASAIYYNPAGLTQNKGLQLTSGMVLGFPSWKFSGPGGSDEMNTPYWLPHFYAASDLGTERWRFGLGLFVPYGNAAEYNPNGPLQFGLVEAEMSVMSITPTVAYQFNKQLSIGAGLNVYYGRTEQEQNFLLPGPTIGRFRFEGDGFAVGATLGLLYKLNDQHAFGLVYRSPFEIEFEDQAQIIGLVPPSDAHANIQFPQSIALGYAFRPTSRLKLEFDIEWTNWDMLDTVDLRSPNPFFDAGSNPLLSIPFHWEDSFFYEFGVEYQCNDRWTLRAGYIFSENTVPDATFTPAVPDSDRHVFSAGLGFRCPRVEFDIAYQYSHSEDRRVSGSPTADGLWETSGHAVVLTSTWKF